MSERLRNLLGYLQLQASQRMRRTDVWVEFEGNAQVPAYRLTYGDMELLVAELKEQSKS